MTDFFGEAFVKLLTWPNFAAYLVLSAAWNCYTGQVRFGDYLDFDKDDTGPFIILVGLKFVAALLILAVYFGG